MMEAGNKHSSNTAKNNNIHLWVSFGNLKVILREEDFTLEEKLLVNLLGRGEPQTLQNLYSTSFK